MKTISYSRSRIDVEYKGKTVSFFGELELNYFLAWINRIQWSIDGKNSPMTTDDKLEVLRIARIYLISENSLIQFIDDEFNPIFFSPHGEPYVSIHGETILSSKPNINCVCETFEEYDKFSDLEFKAFELDLKCHIKNKFMRKAHVWKKYGNYKEQWYKCRKCKKVWGLVYPKDTFKGLWKRIK